MMNERRIIIRVFLASPGDLAEERQVAKEAVDEVNATVATPQGYQIELYGWEDTISAAGRPQAIINDELRQCELFIGMLWSRWGTPPDNDGIFTSGFEEEFSLATELKGKLNKPEIRMYFKNVEESRIKDPGPELQKVLDFQKKLIADKKLLFEKFENTLEFTRKLRIGLAKYVNQKHREREEASQDSENSPELAAHNDLEVLQPEPNALAIQAQFLESMASRLRGPFPDEAITASQIARLRLAAMAEYRAGNDDPQLGPHDANLIYRDRKAFSFDPTEVRQLARFGLEAFSTQNKPLWFWLSATSQESTDWILFETLSSRTTGRQGAFAAAKLLAIDLLVSDVFTREQILDFWLSSDEPDRNRDALSYLRDYGAESDCELILGKIKTATSAITQNYLEAAVAITVRYNITKAFELMVSTPFDQIDASILNESFRGFATADTRFLHLAIEHRNGDVREKGLLELVKRGQASVELGRRFADDASLAVRQIALSIIERYDGDVSLDEVRSIIVKPRPKGIGLFGFGSSNFDLDNHRALERQKIERLSKQPTHILTSLIEGGDIDSDLIYFAMVARDFKSTSTDLRKHFDDRFVDFFAQDIVRMRARLGSTTRSIEIIEKVKQGETWTRRKMMGWSLAALVKNSDPQDLRRICLAIDDKSVDINRSAIEYFAIHGDWSDIPRLSEMSNMRSDEAASILSLSHNFTTDCARAIYKIARGRLNELAELELSTPVLANVLTHANIKDFSGLSDDKISEFLLSDDEFLRKIVSLKIVSTLQTRRAQKIFRRHQLGERYFYNVIHWLDLVVSLPRSKARSTANRALQSLIRA